MSPELRRSENLALIFQEVLTAVERLRANRQGVADPQAFRHHAREALKAAANRALATGYGNEEVKFATFVAIAFLDESVLNSRNPVFAEWLRKPMQEELFGTHNAGEVVFQNLQQILGRTDSHDLADVLEVHHLCLLLGFCGRYSVNRGELSQIVKIISDRIGRIRGPRGALSPAWTLPNEAVRAARRDPWVKRLAILATVAAVLMILLFVGYKMGLNSGLSEIQGIKQAGAPSLAPRPHGLVLAASGRRV